VDIEFRRRNRRMDLRTTTEERELIDRAVRASGTDLTDFVITHASDAARRLLADVNSQPSRDLPGLRRLMHRPTPFTE